MNKPTSSDIERIYSDLAQPNQVLLSAMENILFAIFQGVQEVSRATIQAELKKAQQNQDRKN